jgi:4-amino-4-deoxy-L-arabinose transferase-like glycosyltransferase
MVAVDDVVHRRHPEAMTAVAIPEMATRRQAVGRALQQHALVAILIAAAVNQLLLLVMYPPFQGHDEVSHLAYLATIADEGRLPTFADTLPPELEPYSPFTLDWPALYTANHPPLYYIVALPAFLLAPADYHAQLYAVRLVSVPLFLLTIWLAARLATLVLPGDRFLACCVPAVVAFQPQLSFEGAIVNNDMLAICLGTLSLLLLLGAIRQGLSMRRALLLGVVLGLGLLSKATLTALLPVAGLVAVWCCWPRPWRQLTTRAWWQATLGRALLLLTPVILLALPWYLFLHRTYGDVTAFDATQELQRHWNRPAGTLGELTFSQSFHTDRIHETWGYYGWKLLPLTRDELWFVYSGMLIAAVGLLFGGVRFILHADWRDVATGASPMARSVAAVAVLAIACITMYAATIYFGTMFLLTQARYYFPILPAAIVVALLGFRALTPRHLRHIVAASIVATAAGFQIMLLTRLVFPYAVL